MLDRLFRWLLAERRFYTKSLPLAVPIGFLAACSSGDLAEDDLSNGVSAEALTSYCNVEKPNANAEEWISRITLGSIDNASGASATSYSNFTNLTTQLVMGTSATLVVQPAFGGAILWRTEHWKAWLDLNDDGVFNDAAFGAVGSERLFPTFDTTTNAPGAVSFTVPSAPTPGPKRLRIRMTRLPAARASWQSPCFNQNGEIEDYTVDLR